MKNCNKPTIDLLDLTNLNLNFIKKITNKNLSKKLNKLKIKYKINN